MHNPCPVKGAPRACAPIPHFIGQPAATESAQTKAAPQSCQATAPVHISFPANWRGMPADEIATAPNLYATAPRACAQTIAHRTSIYLGQEEQEVQKGMVHPATTVPTLCTLFEEEAFPVHQLLIWFGPCTWIGAPSQGSGPCTFLLKESRAPRNVHQGERAEGSGVHISLFANSPTSPQNVQGANELTLHPPPPRRAPSNPGAPPPDSRPKE